MKKKVFLGGTCNDSTWRYELIPMLKIDYFNPVVKEWDDEAYKRELLERETCDFVLYTITPEMTGFYSIAESVDDSNKRPEKTVFCVLEKYNEHVFDKFQKRSLAAIMLMIKRNGGKTCLDLNEVAEFLNQNK
jgi:hypothetical protein